MQARRSGWLHVAAGHSDDAKAATQRERGTQTGFVLLYSGTPGHRLPGSTLVKQTTTVRRGIG